MSAAAITVLIADDQRIVREGLSMVLGLMPGVEIVGTASDGQEALALVEQLKPDVVLMDLRMPHCDGVEATRRISDGESGTRVVVLTTYADDHSVIQALRAGACGFLTKDAASSQIAAALQAAKRGESAIDPAVQHHLVKAIARTAPLEWAPPDRAQLPDGLTPRERPAVIRLVTYVRVPRDAHRRKITRRAVFARDRWTCQYCGAGHGALTVGHVIPRSQAAVLTLIAEGLSNAEIAERLTVTETTVKSHVNHLYSKIGARDRAQAVAYAYRHALAPDAAGD